MKRFLQNSKFRLTVFILFCLFFAGNAFGQSTANYTFTTAATGSLASDLNSNAIDMTTGATSRVAASADDTQSTLANIGFDFWLMGTLYTQFSASDNGVLSLGAQPGTGTYVLPNGTTATIAPFANDLRVGTNGVVRSKLIGTSPNRCLVIEYSNVMIRYLASAAAGTGTFQVRLYETTGTVEYVYGEMTTNAAAPAVYNVGFSVNTTANNLVTVNTTANTASTSATVTNNTYTASSTITSLSSASDGSRRFYRFTQTASTAPTALSFSNVEATSMTLNWTDSATNELGYVIYYSTDNTNFTYLGQLPANTTGADVTGFDPGTLYYWRVLAVREGALSTALSGSQATKGGVAFTASGSFTVPCYVTSLTVEAWGGGGRGGARTAANNVSFAGGGGGAYSSSVLTAPFSSPYTVTVGAGSTSAATAGGDSSFGSVVVAKGGASVANDSNVRGAGGLASAGTGTIKFNGGTGAAATSGSFGGGGGSSAGSAAAGNFTNATTTQNAGGIAPLNGGDGGNGALSGAAGIAGTFPGGGGGGGGRFSATNRAPGNGANGQVLVSWTCPSATIAYAGGPFCKSVSSATVTITGTDARTTCTNTFSSTPAGLSINTTTGAINPSASTVGSYTVSYQLAAAGGCSAVNATVTVTIIDVPTIAAITAPSALCPGGSLNPTAPTVTANGSTVSSQGWQLETAVGSGTFATLTLPYTVAYADNGKKIRYTATNGCGTANGNQVTLIINNVPTIATISSPAALCSGGSLNPTAPTVTANGSPVISEGWQLETTVGGGVFATLTIPYTIAFADNGKKIRYTATNGCGTVNGNEVVITVSTANTWTGTTSTAWNTATNWSCGVVPAAVSNVTISTATFYPEISSDVTIYNLTLDSGTTLIVNTSNSLSVTDIVDNDGTITLENNAYLLQTNNVTNTGSGSTIVKCSSSSIMRLDYTLWSSPVTGQGLYAFSPLTFANRFYRYLTLTDLYNNSLGFAITGLDGNGVNGTDSNNVPFATAKGYLIRTPWNHPTTPTIWTGQFTGLPNNGNIGYTLETTGNQFNAVGNPYPSPISISTFLTDNSSLIGSTLWFWRKTNNPNNLITPTTSYITYSGGTYSSGNEPNYNIQPGQGFIVQATTSGSLQFNNLQRVTTDGRFFRNNNQANTAGEGRVWFNLIRGTELAASLAIGYKDGATNDFDADFDGKYINDSSLALTSFVQGQELAVQHRATPFADTDVVPLSFKTNLAGTYSIVFNGADGILNTQDVYLLDLLLNQSVDIKANSYSFTSEAGVFADRFKIVYVDNALGIDDPVFNTNQVVIYQNQVKDFVINTGNIVMSSVKVFDIRGRLILEQKEVNNSQTTINVGQTNEVLLVQITSQEGLVVTKKVIR